MSSYYERNFFTPCAWCGKPVWSTVKRFEKLVQCNRGGKCKDTNKSVELMNYKKYYDDINRATRGY